MTRKQWTFIGAIIILVLLLVAVFVYTATRANEPKSKALKVTASFYPVAEFTREVGGDLVDVTTLVKPGTEPHDYDPSAQDIAGLYQSDVFVYNGAGFETWIPKVQNDLRANGVASIEASQGINLLDASDSSKDPHVWMSPKLAKQEVATIRDGLISADPANAETYRERAGKYIAKLDALDADFRTGLTTCETRTAVTSHQALNYLANEYKLSITSIAGLSPDQEPSAQQLAQIATFVKENEVRYIFFESLVSPKLSQTIAQETGAKTIAFNPLEGLSNSELAAGSDYIAVQRNNLRALQTALGCTQ